MKSLIHRNQLTYSDSAFNCYAPLLKELFCNGEHTITSEQFFKTMQELPQLSQDILRLKCERGHKFTEISIVLNCTASVARYWFEFGKNNLRRKLNPDYYRRKGDVTRLEWVRGASE